MEDGSLITIVMAAGAGLAGTVTVLFKIVMKQATQQSDLSEKVGRLEGRQDGIIKMSDDVLDTVHNAIEARDLQS